MRRVTLLPFLAVLIFSLMPLDYAPSPLTETIVRLDPAEVEFGPGYCVGETFTLAAKIDDVEFLYGIDLKITWNTTYLDYVTHVSKIPLETYPDGLLYEPILVVKNEAEQSEGWFWLVVANLWPAHSFNGSGIAFEITFKVLFQPIEPAPTVHCPVEFDYHNLADLWAGGGPPHDVENCNVTIHPYPDWNSADINGDLKVDISDVILGKEVYGTTPLDPNWNARCDLVEPYGVIDIFDIVMICISYGEEYLP